jgi:hypothetical protein
MQTKRFLQGLYFASEFYRQFASATSVGRDPRDQNLGIASEGENSVEVDGFQLARRIRDGSKAILLARERVGVDDDITRSSQLSYLRNHPLVGIQDVS